MSTVTSGKSVSLNVVPSLTYVLPVVCISVTPFDFANLTSILFFGKSSSFIASGSVLLGSITTIGSLTINICFGTSIEEPSANATFNFPSCFPAVLESLAGFSVSVIVAF